MARAAAHGVTPVTKFADPTALALLPEDARARVVRMREGAPPAHARESMERAFLARRGQMMVARTVVIDDAVREAAAPQVVILGAGLDGRAWRMPELGQTIVFEVDHPDTQREKRARAAALPAVAREVRFVPVDFTRDDLDASLAAAGHDATRPTMWIWEGVVMYLTPAEVAATLAVISRRSAARSRLVLLYTCPALMFRLVGLLVRRVGEPFRSKFKPAAMRALLERHGFAVISDEGLPAIGKALHPTLARDTRIMKHLRIALAEKRP